MARIFSIDFDFQQKQYTALVTSYPAIDGRIQYMVSPNDDLLKKLLPDGKISFHNLSELKPLAESQPRLHELVLSMASALHQKLEFAPG